MQNKGVNMYRGKELMFFASLCLFCSSIEYVLPKPLPFLRLGLSNLPILLSLFVMDSKRVIMLIALKVLGQSFISGTIFSYIFIFSLCGSFASSLVMLLLERLLYRTSLISTIGISLAGAMANAISQIVCTYFLLLGKNTFFVAPILFISSFITGFLLGIFSAFFVKKSKWFKMIQEKELSTYIFNDYKEKVDKGNFILCAVLSLFIFSLICIVIFCTSLYVKIALTFLFFVVNLILRKGRVKILPSIMMIVTITFFSLLSPSGRIIFYIRSFAITEDSLRLGLSKSLILVSMVFASQVIVKLIREYNHSNNFLFGIFDMFSLMTETRVSLKKGHIIEQLDDILLSMWQKHINAEHL